jgi:hypothetical protein
LIAEGFGTAEFAGDGDVLPCDGPTAGNDDEMILSREFLEGFCVSAN